MANHIRVTLEIGPKGKQVVAVWSAAVRHEKGVLADEWGSAGSQSQPNAHV